MWKTPCTTTAAHQRVAPVLTPTALLIALPPRKRGGDKGRGKGRVGISPHLLLPPASSPFHPSQRYEGSPPFIASPPTHSTPSPTLSTSRYAPFPNAHPPHHPHTAVRSNKRIRSRSEGYSADAFVPGLPPPPGPRQSPWLKGEGDLGVGGVGGVGGLRAVQEHEHDAEDRAVMPPSYAPPPPLNPQRGGRTSSAPNSAIILDDRHYTSAPSTPLSPHYGHSHSTTSSPIHRVTYKPRSLSGAAGTAPILASPAHRGGYDGRVSPLMDFTAGTSSGGVSPHFRSPSHRGSVGGSVGGFNVRAPSPRHDLHMHGPPSIKLEAPPPPSHPHPHSSVPHQFSPQGYVVASVSAQSLPPFPVPHSQPSSEDDESLEHPSALATPSTLHPTYHTHPHAVPHPHSQPPYPSTSPPPVLAPAKKARKKRRKSKDLPEHERWYCPLSCGKYFRRTSSRSISEHMKTCPKLQGVIGGGEVVGGEGAGLRVAVPGEGVVVGVGNGAGVGGEGWTPRGGELTHAMEGLALVGRRGGEGGRVVGAEGEGQGGMNGNGKGIDSEGDEDGE